MARRIWLALGASLVGALVGAEPGLAAIPRVQPNSSLPGTPQLQQVAGGLVTVALVLAVVGFVGSLAGLAVSSWSHNSHQREVFRRGALACVLAVVLIGGAEPILNWAQQLGQAIQ
ncbi:MAG TPA: DUF6112 family protein [Solirubrobacteraceae bacterium]|nr:DUF6112 family protein [Solirubrobacteraceae bacterium]